MRFCAFLFTALAVSAWPSRADAQIYAWRDANGTLVLSDRAIDAPTDVYTVAVLNAVGALAGLARSPELVSTDT